MDLRAVEVDEVSWDRLEHRRSEHILVKTKSHLDDNN